MSGKNDYTLLCLRLSQLRKKFKKYGIELKNHIVPLVRVGEWGSYWMSEDVRTGAADVDRVFDGSGRPVFITIRRYIFIIYSSSDSELGLIE